jgi:two-component system CheB/CheR fusion protein
VKKNTQKSSAKKKGSETKKTSLPIHKKDLFIAGIGASAGGLEALKLFFDNAPSDSGMAFVIVQHLDPTHKSLLAELLGEHTKMKVSEVIDGTVVKPNCVYIIPPNKDLNIFHGILQLTEPKEARAKRKTIDSFFHSLAEDQKGRAVGIVLSGTGAEGTLGLKEIKAEGGITIVQDPISAQFAGMPNSAIIAKVADYILTPEKMPAQLLKYVEKINGVSALVADVSNDILLNNLKKIFMMIRNQTGYDFSNLRFN